jgi:dTMP kinase
MMFITFEGADGVGKSTQVKLFKDFLELNGFQVILTREPGGTSFSEKIREIILSENGISDKMVEYLLFTAARRHHVETLIKPALLGKKIVICDRFLDSSLVYQGYIGGLNLDKIRNIYRECIGDFFPDITFLIDLDSENALSRINSRGATNKNHYDNQTIASHKQIRDSFITLASSNEKAYIINGNLTQEKVLEQIIKIFEKSLAKYEENN